MATGLGLLATAGIWGIWAYSNKPDTCSSELLINGRKLDFEAAIKDWSLKTAASPEVKATITEKLAFYQDETARLCRELAAGSISQKDYSESREKARRWYMHLLELEAKGQLASVAGAGVKDDSSADQKPADTVSQMVTATLINSDGAILPSGATVHRGDRIRLEIAVPRPSYIYVLGLGSSGNLYRIFPSSLSALKNPVSGSISVPQVEGRYMGVSGEVGTEQLHVFVSDRDDAKISAVPQIGDKWRPSAALVKAVKQEIIVRDLFAEPPPKPAAAVPNPRPINVQSRYGKAVVTYTLNNAG